MKLIMKIIKSIISGSMILFGILGLLNIFPLDITVFIIYTFWAISSLLTSIECKKNKDDKGFMNNILWTLFFGVIAICYIFIR